MEITLPHYLSDDPDIVQQLCFLKANHKYTRNENGYYNFEPTDGRTDFDQAEGHGTLYTDHFCSVCMAGKGVDLAKQANYCIMEATPRSTRVPPWDIYFGVMYFLSTCIQVCLAIMSVDALECTC